MIAHTGISCFNRGQWTINGCRHQDTILTCPLQQSHHILISPIVFGLQLMGLCHQMLNQPLPMSALLRGIPGSISVSALCHPRVAVIRAVTQTEGIEKYGPTQCPNRIHGCQYLNSAAAPTSAVISSLVTTRHTTLTEL